MILGAENRKDIFLDFLNPDLRKAWGVYDSHAFNKKFLKELVNTSVLLTNKTCYLPLAFILEDPFTFNLAQNVQSYFEEGYIQIPMKLTDNLGVTLSHLFETYRNVKNNYTLFNNENQFAKAVQFINDIYFARTEKKYSTGKIIAKSFLNQLEHNNEYWTDILEKYPNKIIKIFQKIPENLLSKGLSVTHGDIINELGVNKMDIFDIHNLLNFEYGRVYMEEFDAISLYNILNERFFSPTNKKENKGYDYQIIRKSFNALNIRDFVSLANANDIITLRQKYIDYHIFIKNYFKIANAQKDTQSIETYFAEVISNSENLNRHLSKRYVSNQSLSYFIDTIGLFNAAVEEDKPIEQAKKMEKIISQSVLKKITLFKISIFVALKEEEDILREILDLKYDKTKQIYTKVIKGVKFEIFSPRHIGRVSAAIKTYQYLLNCGEELPNLLIVAGIAGGFESKGLNRGDLIVPTFVLDISNTKKEGKQNEQSRNEIIRSQPFQLYKQLGKYLDSPDFDTSKWAMKMKESPIGKSYQNRVPNIIYKPISCCDSVIKDEEWIAEILKINQEITGVEMESGGVCYAVEEFSKGTIPISVVRGISDLANPYKADDIWRTVAMSAVANLIKEINFNHLLS